MIEINDNTLKVVALDCFDTIIHRDCHPETILYIWARNVCAEIKFIISPKELYKMRKQSERNLRNSLGVDEVSYKELLRDIYGCLNSINAEKLGIDFESFFYISYSIEKKTEIDHIKLDKDTINLIESYKKNGKKIIVISDFYLNKTFFIDMFSQLGILDFIDDIYISSEFGKRKSTGKLYNHVISSLGIHPQNMLMIGDNEKSDIDIPKKIGIKTNYRPYIEKESIVSERKIKKKIKQISCKKEVNTEFNGFVPILILFISRLYESLIKENCRKVLFCSREGQKLKVLFDEYQRILFGDIKITSHYFYVSRRSTFLPSLRDVNSEDFSRIFRQYKVLTLYDFLSSIGFKKNEIYEIQKMISCNLEQEVSSPKNDAFLKKFISNPHFINIYDKKRKCQKNLLKQYIHQFGIDIDSETVHIVDIGWKGTIQDNLFNAFDQNTNIHGYYFGLFKHEKSNKNAKSGLIFSQSPESKNYNILSYNYVELERVFAANHGPTLGYIHLGKEVIPEISKDISEIEIYEYVRHMQDVMTKEFISLVEMMKASIILPADIEHLIIKCHLRQLSINMPKQNIIYLEFRKKYKENFGSMSGVKDKSKIKFIKEHMERSKFLFVDYSYRILERYHLKILYPLADLYCHAVYILKLLTIK